MRAVQQTKLISHQQEVNRFYRGVRKVSRAVVLRGCQLLEEAGSEVVMVVMVVVMVVVGIMTAAYPGWQVVAMSLQGRSKQNYMAKQPVPASRETGPAFEHHIYIQRVPNVRRIIMAQRI